MSRRWILQSMIFLALLICPSFHMLSVWIYSVALKTPIGLSTMSLIDESNPFWKNSQKIQTLVWFIISIFWPMLILKKNFIIDLLCNSLSSPCPLISPKTNFYLYLSWIAGVVAGVLKREEVWLIFLVFNTLQGPCVFSCSKKMVISVKERVYSHYQEDTNSSWQWSVS